MFFLCKCSRLLCYVLNNSIYNLKDFYYYYLSLVRSLGSVSLRMSEKPEFKFHFNYFAVDFNEVRIKIIVSYFYSFNNSYLRKHIYMLDENQALQIFLFYRNFLPYMEVYL